MIPNAHELRKNAKRFGRRQPGGEQPLKPVKHRIKLRSDVPADILTEEDAEDPEAEVELNTWSSQAAYAKALEGQPDDAVGGAEAIDARHEQALQREEQFSVALGERKADGFQAGRFIEVKAKPALSKSGARSNIWHAALHGDVQTVEFLVQVRCVPASVRNHWGQTALHCAARNGHAAVLAVLLKYEGRTWMREQEGNTALHLCAYFGHTACAKLLLQYGASTTAINAFGHTPWDEAREQANVSGPRGDGPREVAEVIAHAMAEQPDGLRQIGHEDSRLPVAFRSYHWDDRGDPHSAPNAAFPGSAAEFPDEEDGFAGYGGKSSILKRLHGLLDELIFFDRASMPIAKAALAPALVTIPLLFIYRGDASDTVAELREVSWIGSGGTAHWSCCMPWQPAFIAVLVNLVPSCMLPMYVAPKLSHSCRIRVLPIWDSKLGYRHRTVGVWVVALALLFFATLLCCAASSLAAEHRIHYGFVHAWSLLLNYALLVAVRRVGAYMFEGQLPMVKERALIKPMWAVRTLHALLSLVLPSLVLDNAAGTAPGSPPPLACCLQIDQYGEDLVQRTAYLRSVECFSEQVFVYFSMSYGLSLLYRLGWEYWEYHKMIGWRIIERTFYSPTALYGSRESIVPLIADYQLGVAFAIVNPYLHPLAAVNVLLHRYGLALRNRHYRPHARGTAHPAPREATALLWPTPFFFVLVVWLLLPSMGMQHTVAAISSWLVLFTFFSLTGWRVRRLHGLWAKQAEESWSAEYVAMHREIGALAVAEIQRRDFLELGHSNWKYEDEERSPRRRGSESGQVEEVLAIDGEPVMAGNELQHEGYLDEPLSALPGQASGYGSGPHDDREQLGHRADAASLEPEPGPEPEPNLETEEEAALMLQAFNAIDTDNSGVLDREQVHALTDMIGKRLTDGELDAAMSELDGDGSGAVEFTEFAAYWEANFSASDTLLKSIIANYKTAGRAGGQADAPVAGDQAEVEPSDDAAQQPSEPEPETAKTAEAALQPHPEPEPEPDRLELEQPEPEPEPLAADRKLLEEDDPFIYGGQAARAQSRIDETEYRAHFDEHLTRAGTVIDQRDGGYSSSEVVADRKSLEILEKTLGPAQVAAGHPGGMDSGVGRHYHTRVPPHARVSGGIGRPEDDGSGMATLGGDHSVVHHPQSTAAELPIDEALALADAADETLARLENYRQGRVGMGRRKYAHGGTIVAQTAVRVLQSALVPDSTELMRRGQANRARAQGPAA